MRAIKEIIIHCSAYEGIKDQFDAIKEDHILVRGFNDIGYHYFIEPDGTLKYGRPLDVVGAHCEGHNKGSVGICLAGNYNFYVAQFGVLGELIKSLRYVLDPLKVKLHNEYNNKKSCPNFTMEDAGL